MGEWVETSLANLIDVKHGYAFKGKNIVSEETDKILITPGNFHIGGGFKTDKFKYFNAEHPEEYVLRKEQIVVTMTDLSKEGDTLGYSAKIPQIENKVLLHNQRIGLVKFISDTVNPDFLYWVLRTKPYQWFILGSATGTSVRHTSPSRIKEYSFFAPKEIEEQKAIAGVLSCLDEKIDLLHRQNKTLEALAETLFRHNFIDNVRDDWEEKQVSNIANHIKTNIKPQNNASTLYYHYSLPAYDSAMRPIEELGSEIKSNKYAVPANSILVSKLNPRLPRIWPIGAHAKENAICSTEFQVFQPKNEKLFGFLLYLFKSQDARDYLEMAASGTSGSHQRVSPKRYSEHYLQME